MPAEHEIDSETKVIITTWRGDVTDDDLIVALTSYLKEFRSADKYCHHYNELLDFSHATEISLTTKGVIELSKISHQSDIKGIQTKLAIIATSPLTFGLAKMYVAYRNLLSGSKVMDVFKNRDHAFTWLNSPINQ